MSKIDERIKEIQQAYKQQENIKLQAIAQMFRLEGAELILKELKEKEEQAEKEKEAAATPEATPTQDIPKPKKPQK